MALARLVKLSDEDADLFYGEPPETVAARLFAMGVEIVLLTHGSAGASVFTRGGLKASVPIAASDRPLVDTMGAGDATLATVVAFILRRGMPSTQVRMAGLSRRSDACRGRDLCQPRRLAGAAGGISGGGRTVGLGLQRRSCGRDGRSRRRGRLAREPDLRLPAKTLDSPRDADIVRGKRWLPAPASGTSEEVPAQQQGRSKWEEV